jgi:predicted nuclease of predicted toxin-antitoxin system
MVQFYADENFDGRIIRGLRSRNVDVITALEDGRDATDDTDVFRRSSELGRVLLSHDEDVLRIAEHFLRDGVEFAGLVYVHLLNTTIGNCIADLELIDQCQSAEEYVNYILRLPL